MVNMVEYAADKNSSITYHSIQYADYIATSLPDNTKAMAPAEC
jgi:hypothetical protein